jgi:sugar phosphate isomerase/epimerase
MTVHSLSYLTVALVDPLEAIRVAAEAGYLAVGLRGAPSAPGGAFSPLIGDAALVREVNRACRDEGIRVLDLEIIRIGVDFEVESVKPLLRLGGELGVTSLTVVCGDPVEARAMESFGDLCEAAGAFGSNCGLEYMPRTGVASVSTALRIVSGVRQPNARLLFDPLHTARTGSPLEDLAAIPPSLLDYLQLCDAPGDVPPTEEGLLYTARSERLLPGEGDIDLHAMFKRLPGNLPISVEIPSVSRQSRMGATAWARQALSASRAFMDRLKAGA